MTIMVDYDNVYVHLQPVRVLLQCGLRQTNLAEARR